jgi:hypothetical protein
MTARLDLSAFVHLRISDADHPNVWLIRLPRMIWNHAAAGEERRTIVDELTAACPRRSLWLSDWAADGAPHWLRLTAADDLFRCEGLDNGGWALLFFSGDQLAPVVPLNQLPTGAAEANELLNQLSASAVIISLVDNDEWLLAIAK